MLTKITITVPDLGDNRKNLEVEGALAAGEKATVTLVGIPSGTTTDGTELRLRVLGPIGEDLATHGDWTVGTDGEYTTDLNLATLQAYRLFVPPPPPPPPPNVRPVPRGYLPVRPGFNGSVDVRLLVELRTDGDASMLGMRTRPLVYWPTDWKTATLIDLADGRVYSKEDVDALIAAEQQARASGDASTLASAKAHADTKYAKPAGGIPRSDLASDVRASLGKADTAIQQHQDISGKADKEETYTKSEVNSLVASTGGKFIVVQTLPSAASADPKAIYLVPRTTSETGNIYDEYVRVEPTAGTYAWEKFGSTEIDLSAYRTAAAQDVIDAGKASTADATLTDVSVQTDWVIADGLLEAAQANLPDIHDPSRLELSGSSLEFAGSDGAGGERRFILAICQIESLSATLLSSLYPWVTAIIPPGGTVATRSTVSAYQLGSQSDKPLAPAGNYALKSEAMAATADGNTILTGGTVWEGAPIGVFADAITARVGARAPLNTIAAEYSESGSYETGDVVWYTDNIYECIASTPSPAGGFNNNFWTTVDVASLFDKKQDAITDLATIRSGAAAGATAVQPSGLTNYVQKSQTAGLLKNDGTVDTNTYLTTAPVTSVNGQTGAVTLAIPDISGKLDANKRNLLDYTSGTTLAPGTAVYRSSLNADGTFPTVDATAIPTAAAYYQFELELTVPSTVPSTITGPSGWTWLDGHGLPDPADLSGGETICISVRLDCTARTFLASVWRVA